MVEESVLHALSPYAADAAVLRAIGLGEQIGHYIIPEQYGKPRIFLLVRDPSALLERRGWLQLTEGHGFTHLNNDPVEFPCNFIYRGTGKFAVHAQTEVGIENLTRPLVEVPKRLAFHEVLMRVSSIREVDGSLLVRYLDGRPSENLPLFTP